MPVLATGGAPIYNSLKAIRLMRHGCANRPFYHIVIMGSRRSNKGTYPVIEQLGTYDPLTNVHGEKLVSVNLDRISYWMAQDKVKIAVGVKQLLGLMGFLHIHPQSYITAWRVRAIAKREALSKQQAEDQEASMG
ncbi:probable 28S ribosomal protein S16, mitochondrial [Hyalella azteca]|uniref:Small ribosomal subunit protein bS16m n=1 Tax=Hyalella azteca TaxID=294128 RepID=A0A8B7P1I7_HYAAZ|nr:probable 28S ribosomal protein S16, mitochondrial [Hyalella azteca]